MHNRAIALNLSVPQSSYQAPFSSGFSQVKTAVPAGACDCHLHVYSSAFQTAQGAKLRPPDASIEDYRKVQKRTKLTRAVLVTPSTYGYDNRSMLQGLAELGEQGRGVAVIDGRETDAELQAMHALGVRGARLNLSMGVSCSLDMLRPLAHRIAPLGWHLQLLMPATMLAENAELLGSLPVPLVFDHFGRISPQDVGTAAHSVLLKLLVQERAWVKLSGGYIVSQISTIDDPTLHALAKSFLDAAPHRVVWGSDWPHATASAGLHPMPDDARQIEQLAAWVSTSEMLHSVLVDNPQALYGFSHF